MDHLTLVSAECCRAVPALLGSLLSRHALSPTIDRLSSDWVWILSLESHARLNTCRVLHESIKVVGLPSM